jgi:Fe-S cluster assembly protein SufD
MPNLLVRTNSVIANHNATISMVNESYLFYLMSKGLNKTSAIRLIKNGFLKGILKINELKIGGENFYE